MNMYGDSKRAWLVEISAEAVRLIEIGIPPSTAIRQATENINRRRRWLRAKEHDATPSKL